MPSVSLLSCLHGAEIRGVQEPLASIVLRCGATRPHSHDQHFPTRHRATFHGPSHHLPLTRPTTCTPIPCPPHFAVSCVRHASQPLVICGTEVSGRSQRGPGAASETTGLPRVSDGAHRHACDGDLYDGPADYQCGLHPLAGLRPGPPPCSQALSGELAAAGVPSLSLNPITAANCLKVLRHVLQRQMIALADDQVWG